MNKKIRISVTYIKNSFIKIKSLDGKRMESDTGKKNFWYFLIFWLNEENNKKH